MTGLNPAGRRTGATNTDERIGAGGLRRFALSAILGLAILAASLGSARAARATSCSVNGCQYWEPNGGMAILCDGTWQPLTQGWFIDLDRSESGAFQVSYLLAERQCNLAARRLTWLVVANEGPIEHGYRTSQHPLDRFVGQRLRIGTPTDRHRRGARNIAIDDWWTYIS